jgi:hypothetical protein
MRHDRNSLHSEATINLDVRTVDVARQILYKHTHGMGNLLRLRKCTGGYFLLIPMHMDQQITSNKTIDLG